jgi:hypothetical protein
LINLPNRFIPFLRRHGRITPRALSESDPDRTRKRDPMERAFEAHPMTILLNIAIPAVLGLLIGILMRTLEKILRKKRK